MADTATNPAVSRYAEVLLSKRNQDGTWAYRTGPGIAECTCYSLLALKAANALSDADSVRALDWLEALRREDGGYAPQPAVAFSNWVTSLASIVFAVFGRDEARRSGVEWLLGRSGVETQWMPRTVRNLFGAKNTYPLRHHGWPWIENTNAWIAPTSLAVVALLLAAGKDSDPRIPERIREAQLMILDRRCADGGWNYGAPEALDVKAVSYPETTGIALLGLQGVSPAEIEGADALAQRMLADARYATGVSWLQLGLNARGIPSNWGKEEAIQCRTNLDLSLRILALRAIDGNNVLKA